RARQCRHRPDHPEPLVEADRAHRLRARPLRGVAEGSLLRAQRRPLSSREHAVWALRESGFRAVIAPTIADIFKSNAIKNGLVPVELESDAVSRLLAAVKADAGTTITVDVAQRTVAAPGLEAPFALADFFQTYLLEGLDDIALALRHESDIAAFEAKRAEWLPRVR